MINYVPCKPTSTTIPFLGCCKEPPTLKWKTFGVVGELYGFYGFVTIGVFPDNKLYRNYTERVILPEGTYTATHSIDADGIITKTTSKTGDFDSAIASYGVNLDQQYKTTTETLETGAMYWSNRKPYPYTVTIPNKGRYEMEVSSEIDLVSGRSEILSILAQFDVTSLAYNKNQYRTYKFASRQISQPIETGGIFSDGTATYLANVYRYTAQATVTIHYPQSTNDPAVIKSVGDYVQWIQTACIIGASKSAWYYPGVACRNWTYNTQSTAKYAAYKMNYGGDAKNGVLIEPDIVSFWQKTVGMIYFKDVSPKYPLCCQNGAIDIEFYGG